MDMKLTAGARRSTAGFTMLEMVVVLFIMMLMIALGVAAFRIYDDHDPFEEPAAKITRMARFALHSAALHHQGKTIAFDKTGFGMVGASGSDGAYYSVPEDMKLLLMRWGGKNWEKAEGQTWEFGEQGICQPLKVRFATREGVRDIEFHPLTGKPVDP